MKIWIVDDDPGNRGQFKRDLEEHDVKCFEDIYDAMKNDSQVDVIILDITACSMSFGMGGIDLHSVYSPILGLWKKHQSSTILVVSGFNKDQLKDAFDTIKEMEPDADIRYVSCNVDIQHYVGNHL